MVPWHFPARSSRKPHLSLSLQKPSSRMSPQPLQLHYNQKRFHLQPAYLPLHLLSFPCSFAPSLESYALPCAFGDGTPISVYIIGHLPWIVNNLSANLLMKWANPISNAQFVTDCLTFCLFFSRDRGLHGT